MADEHPHPHRVPIRRDLPGMDQAEEVARHKARIAEVREQFKAAADLFKPSDPAPEE